MITNPESIHLIAHEASDQEIAELFRTQPWCKRVRLWTGQEISKEEFAERMRDKQIAETRQYKVT